MPSLNCLADIKQDFSTTATVSRSGSNRLQVADLLAQDSQLSSKKLASTSAEAATPSAFERHAAKSPEFSKELSLIKPPPSNAAQNLIQPNRML